MEYCLTIKKTGLAVVAHATLEHSGGRDKWISLSLRSACSKKASSRTGTKSIQRNLVSKIQNKPFLARHDVISLGG